MGFTLRPLYPLGKSCQYQTEGRLGTHDRPFKWWRSVEMRRLPGNQTPNDYTIASSITQLATTKYCEGMTLFTMTLN